ncbi:M28 family peptidase [Streptomyces liangshanensis]|uniref:M28 family peptidase n=2 Tax=Streptomyces liangshanensis TaxID=2717324 RepID=A0A6G9H9T9_9ACTN|nr:M28 family peptidase [Streptomyces liangshanensis]
MAIATATALAAPLLMAAAPAGKAPSHRHGSHTAQDAAKLSRKLVREASAQDVLRHLKKFQSLADANDGNRAAGTPGHDASAAYVYNELKKAGYKVSYQTFQIAYIETLAETLRVTSPTPRDVDISALSYTKSTPVGGVTAALAAVPVDATTGCEAGDYAAGAFTGKIALIQRGGCTFAVKQQEAAAAGAVAAIIYNNTTGVISGTLGDPNAGVIPTGGITQADGQALAAEVAQGPVTVTAEIRQLQEQRNTRNVIAETKAGKADRTVMLGAHLDSVNAGPGINDNGSGSAGLLDVALDLAKTHDKPANKVRFAWWSAEELGLLGAEAYVAALTPEQKADVALYLNFDMIGSKNFAQFVYDGDDSDATGAGPGPDGSAQLEKGITGFLDRRGLPHEGTDFDGRSDYGPFIDAGIPSGGTFTGAEGIKTAAQAQKYGGQAGVAYDACYHSACDDLSNINKKALDVNVDIIADAVGTYAHDLRSIPQRPAAAGAARLAGTDTARTADGHTATS